MRILILIFFLFSSILFKAQSSTFKVECGQDTFFCLGLYADTFHIGTQVKLTNGVGPYQFAWSCKPIKVSSKLTYTASAYLNDTSIINPYIMGFGVENQPWCFYLTVIDNIKNIATDSIFIECSSFIYSLAEHTFYLNQGDSVHFIGEHFVGGGIPPVKHYWNPSSYLNDSTKIDAWCNPKKSTDYYQYIIDSKGCKSVPKRVYNIYVTPTSIKKINLESSHFLNLQQNGERLVFNNPQNKLALLSFYSVDGKKILSTQTNNSFFELSNLPRKQGILICKVWIDGIFGSVKIY